jgi:hypothetical protein
VFYFRVRGVMTMRFSVEVLWFALHPPQAPHPSSAHAFDFITFNSKRVASFGNPDCLAARAIKAFSLRLRILGA